MRLTQKQKAFLTAYLGNGRCAAAAYRASHNPNADDQRAKEEGYRLLKNPKIAPLIAEADARAAAAVERVIDAAAFDQEALAQRLLHLGLFDVRSILSWSDNKVRLKPSSEISDAAAFAITEIREGPHGLSIKLADKRAALMDLAKLRGWLVDRGQTLGADGKPVDPQKHGYVLQVIGVES